MNEKYLPPELCDFCSELLGDLHNTNFGKLAAAQTKGRILWQNSEFALIPTLGPIVEGHLLLIPLQHVFSFANFSYFELEKAEIIINLIYQFYSTQNKKMVSFKHGACVHKGLHYEKRIKKALSGACTDHAHFHLIPDVPITEILKRIETQDLIVKKKRIKKLSSLPKSADNASPYVIIGGSDTPFWHLYIVEELPSQFMREIAASFVRLEDWSWISNPRIDLIINTLNKIGLSLNKFMKYHLK